MATTLQGNVHCERRRRPTSGICYRCITPSSKENTGIVSHETHEKFRWRLIITLTEEPVDSRYSTPALERDKLIWILIASFGPIVDEALMSHELAVRLQPCMARRRTTRGGPATARRRRKRHRGSGGKNQISGHQRGKRRRIPMTAG